MPNIRLEVPTYMRTVVSKIYRKYQKKRITIEHEDHNETQELAFVSKS